MSLTTLVLVTVLVSWTVADYTIPEPKFQLLKPRGFRVSIPDEDGIQLFAFHANLNKPMEFLGTGQISEDIDTKSKGRWVYENLKLKIREGDVLNYWIFVLKNGIGYRMDYGVYKCEGMDFYRQSKKHTLHTVKRRYAHYPQDNWDGGFEGGYAYPPPFDHKPNKDPYNSRYHQPGGRRGYNRYRWHTHHGYQGNPYEHYPNRNHNHNHNHHNCGEDDDYNDVTTMTDVTIPVHPTTRDTKTTDGPITVTIPADPVTRPTMTLTPVTVTIPVEPVTVTIPAEPVTITVPVERVTIIVPTPPVPDIDIRFGEK